MKESVFKWIDKEKLYQLLVSERLKQRINPFVRKLLSRNTFQWLTQSYNLTETIKQTGAIFSLKLVEQTFGKPLLEEINAFHTIDCSSDDSDYWVRKIFLEADGIPFIFARVVAPNETYRSYCDDFERLGNAPIGNTLLYSDQRIKRTEFEYRLLQTHELLIQEINRARLLSTNSLEPIEELKLQARLDCWMRRSLFHLPKGVLLITEIFLHPLPKFPFG